MKKACRLRAKGEIISFDTEEGIKEYRIKPIKNEQLLEITDLGEKNKGMEAALLMAKYSLNRDSKIENGTEEPFDDEEIKQMEVSFLIPLLKKCAEINGLGDMFDFQARAEKQLPSQSNPLVPELGKNTVVVGNSARRILS